LIKPSSVKPWRVLSLTPWLNPKEKIIENKKTPHKYRYTMEQEGLLKSNFPEDI